MSQEGPELTMFAVVAAVGGRSSTEITDPSEEAAAGVWCVVVSEQELERYAIGPPSVLFGP